MSNFYTKKVDSFTSNSEFDLAERVQIVNEIPPQEMITQLVSSLAKNPLWQWFLGQSAITYDIEWNKNTDNKEEFDNEGYLIEPGLAKYINGVRSMDYGPIPTVRWDQNRLDNEGRKDPGYVTKYPTGARISIEGTILPEVDLFLHEIYRYLYKFYPDHPDYTKLLTKNEINDIFESIGCLLDYDINCEYFDNLSKYLPYNKNLTEDELAIAYDNEAIKLKIRNITNNTLRRKLYGTIAGYNMLAGDVFKKVHTYQIAQYIPYLGKDVSEQKHKDIKWYYGKETNDNVDDVPVNKLDSKYLDEFRLIDLSMSSYDNVNSFVSQYSKGFNIPDEYNVYEFNIAEDNRMPSTFINFYNKNDAILINDKETFIIDIVNNKTSYVVPNIIYENNIFVNYYNSYIDNFYLTYLVSRDYLLDKVDTAAYVYPNIKSLVEYIYENELGLAEYEAIIKIEQTNTMASAVKFLFKNIDIEYKSFKAIYDPYSSGSMYMPFNQELLMYNDTINISIVDNNLVYIDDSISKDFHYKMKDLLTLGKQYTAENTYVSVISGLRKSKLLLDFADTKLNKSLLKNNGFILGVVLLINNNYVLLNGSLSLKDGKYFFNIETIDVKKQSSSLKVLYDNKWAASNKSKSYIDASSEKYEILVYLNSIYFFNHRALLESINNISKYEKSSLIIFNDISEITANIKNKKYTSVIDPLLLNGLNLIKGGILELSDYCYETIPNNRKLYMNNLWKEFTDDISIDVDTYLSDIDDFQSKFISLLNHMIEDQQSLIALDIYANYYVSIESKIKPKDLEKYNTLKSIDYNLNIMVKNRELLVNSTDEFNSNIKNSTLVEFFTKATISDTTKDYVIYEKLPDLGNPSLIIQRGVIETSMIINDNLDTVPPDTTIKITNNDISYNNSFYLMKQNGVLSIEDKAILYEYYDLNNLIYEESLKNLHDTHFSYMDYSLVSKFNITKNNENNIRTVYKETNFIHILSTIDLNSSKRVIYFQDDTSRKYIDYLNVGNYLSGTSIEPDTFIVSIDIDGYSVEVSKDLNTSGTFLLYYTTNIKVPSYIEEEDLYYYKRLNSTVDTQIENPFDNGLYGSKFWPNVSKCDIWPIIDTTVFHDQLIRSLQTETGYHSMFNNLVNILHSYKKICLPSFINYTNRLFLDINIDDVNKDGKLLDISTLDYFNSMKDVIARADSNISIGSHLVIETDTSEDFTLTNEDYTDPSIKLKAKTISWQRFRSIPTYIQIGNGDLSKNINNFWNRSTIKVDPISVYKSYWDSDLYSDKNDNVGFKSYWADEKRVEEDIYRQSLYSIASPIFEKVLGEYEVSMEKYYKYDSSSYSVINTFINKQTYNDVICSNNVDIKIKQKSFQDYYILDNPYDSMKEVIDSRGNIVKIFDNNELITVHYEGVWLPNSANSIINWPAIENVISNNLYYFSIVSSVVLTDVFIDEKLTSITIEKGSIIISNDGINWVIETFVFGGLIGSSSAATRCFSSESGDVYSINMCNMDAPHIEIIDDETIYKTLLHELLFRLLFDTRLYSTLLLKNMSNDELTNEFIKIRESTEMQEDVKIGVYYKFNHNLFWYTFIDGNESWDVLKKTNMKEGQAFAIYFYNNRFYIFLVNNNSSFYSMISTDHNPQIDLSNINSLLGINGTTISPENLFGLIPKDVLESSVNTIKLPKTNITKGSADIKFIINPEFETKGYLKSDYDINKSEAIETDIIISSDPLYIDALNKTIITNNNNIPYVVKLLSHKYFKNIIHLIGTYSEEYDNTTKTQYIRGINNLLFDAYDISLDDRILQIDTVDIRSAPSNELESNLISSYANIEGFFQGVFYEDGSDKPLLSVGYTFERGTKVLPEKLKFSAELSKIIPTSNTNNNVVDYTEDELYFPSYWRNTLLESPIAEKINVNYNSIDDVSKQAMFKYYKNTLIIEGEFDASEPDKILFNKSTNVSSLWDYISIGCKISSIASLSISSQSTIDYITTNSIIKDIVKADFNNGEILILNDTGSIIKSKIPSVLSMPESLISTDVMIDIEGLNLSKLTNISYDISENLWLFSYKSLSDLYTSKLIAYDSNNNLYNEIGTNNGFEINTYDIISDFLDVDSKKPTPGPYDYTDLGEVISFDKKVRVKARDIAFSYIEEDSFEIKESTDIEFDEIKIIGENGFSYEFTGTGFESTNTVYVDRYDYKEFTFGLQSAKKETENPSAIIKVGINDAASIYKFDVNKNAWIYIGDSSYCISTYCSLYQAFYKTYIVGVDLSMSNIPPPLALGCENIFALHLMNDAEISIILNTDISTSWLFTMPNVSSRPRLKQTFIGNAIQYSEGIFNPYFINNSVLPVPELVKNKLKSTKFNVYNRDGDQAIIIGDHIFIKSLTDIYNNSSSVIGYTTNKHWKCGRLPLQTRVENALFKDVDESDVSNLYKYVSTLYTNIISLIDAILLDSDLNVDLRDIYLILTTWLKRSPLELYVHGKTEYVIKDVEFGLNELGYYPIFYDTGSGKNKTYTLDINNNPGGITKIEQAYADYISDYFNIILGGTRFDDYASSGIQKLEMTKSQLILLTSNNDMMSIDLSKTTSREKIEDFRNWTINKISDKYNVNVASNNMEDNNSLIFAKDNKSYSLPLLSVNNTKSNITINSSYIKDDIIVYGGFIQPKNMIDIEHVDYSIKNNPIFMSLYPNNSGVSGVSIDNAILFDKKYPFIAFSNNSGQSFTVCDFTNVKDKWGTAIDAYKEDVKDFEVSNIYRAGNSINIVISNEISKVGITSFSFIANSLSYNDNWLEVSTEEISNSINNINIDNVDINILSNGNLALVKPVSIKINDVTNIVAIDKSTNSITINTNEPPKNKEAIRVLVSIVPNKSLSNQSLFLEQKDEYINTLGNFIVADKVETTDIKKSNRMYSFREALSTSIEETIIDGTVFPYIQGQRDQTTLGIPAISEDINKEIYLYNDPYKDGNNNDVYTYKQVYNEDNDPVVMCNEFGDYLIERDSPRSNNFYKLWHLLQNDIDVNTLVLAPQLKDGNIKISANEITEKINELSEFSIIYLDLTTDANMLLDSKDISILIKYFEDKGLLYKYDKIGDNLGEDYILARNYIIEYFGAFNSYNNEWSEEERLLPKHINGNSYIYDAALGLLMMKAKMNFNLLLKMPYLFKKGSEFFEKQNFIINDNILTSSDINYPITGVYLNPKGYGGTNTNIEFDNLPWELDPSAFEKDLLVNEHNDFIYLCKKNGSFYYSKYGYDFFKPNTNIDIEYHSLKQIKNTISIEGTNLSYNVFKAPLTTYSIYTPKSKLYLSGLNANEDAEEIVSVIAFLSNGFPIDVSNYDIHIKSNNVDVLGLSIRKNIAKNIYYIIIDEKFNKGSIIDNYIDISIADNDEYIISKKMDVSFEEEHFRVLDINYSLYFNNMLNIDNAIFTNVAFSSSVSFLFKKELDVYWANKSSIITYDSNIIISSAIDFKQNNNLTYIININDLISNKIISINNNNYIEQIELPQFNIIDFYMAVFQPWNNDTSLNNIQLCSADNCLSRKLNIATHYNENKFTLYYNNINLVYNTSVYEPSTKLILRELEDDEIRSFVLSKGDTFSDITTANETLLIKGLYSKILLKRPKFLNYSELVFQKGRFINNGLNSELIYKYDSLKEQLTLSEVNLDSKYISLITSDILSKCINKNLQIKILPKKSVFLKPKHMNNYDYISEVFLDDISEFGFDRVCFNNDIYPEQQYKINNVIYNEENSNYYSNNNYTNKSNNNIYLCDEFGRYIKVLSRGNDLIKEPIGDIYGSCIDDVNSSKDVRYISKFPLYETSYDWFVSDFYIENEKQNPFWQYLNIREEIIDGAIVQKGELYEYLKVNSNYVYTTPKDAYCNIVGSNEYINNLKGELSFLLTEPSSIFKTKEHLIKYGIQYKNTFYNYNSLHSDIWVKGGFLKNDIAYSYIINSTEDLLDITNTSSSLVSISELGIFDQNHRLIMYSVFPPIEYKSDVNHFSTTILIRSNALTDYATRITD